MKKSKYGIKNMQLSRSIRQIATPVLFEAIKETKMFK